MKSRHIWYPLSWFYTDRRRDDSTPATPGWLDKFNDRLAIRMTIIFGSIWCVYAFILFSLLPVFKPQWQDGLLYVSNAIQLVALPALMVGSAILARGNEQRAAEDHTALMEILSDVREEVARLRAMTVNIAEQEIQNSERPTDVVSISDDAVIAVNEPSSPVTGGTRSGA